MSDSVTIIECSDGKALNALNALNAQKNLRFLCEICNIKCSSQCDYHQHLSGIKHLKKLESEQNLEKKNRCEICDVECTNQFHRAIIVKS